MKRNPQPLPLLPITWLTWPGRTPSWALNQDDRKCIMFFFFKKNLTLYLTDHFVVYIVIY